MKILIRWIINAGILLLIGQYMPGIELTGWYSALVAIFILGFINALIKPLFVLLTLPVNLLTLGLFTFVINALLFWFASSIVEGFVVEGFGAAFLGALVVTVAGWAVNIIFKKD